MKDFEDRWSDKPVGKAKTLGQILQKKKNSQEIIVHCASTIAIGSGSGSVEGGRTAGQNKEVVRMRESPCRADLTQPKPHSVVCGEQNKTGRSTAEPL